MKPGLESLLEAYDAFFQAREERSKVARRRFYFARLAEVSAETGTAADVLDKAIRVRHPLWLRAQAKTSTLPPKA